MTTKDRKLKGKRLQNLVRDKLRELFNELEPGDIESTMSSAAGVDIILSPAAKRIIPIAIECKNQENLRIHQAIEQAESNANGLEPVVVFSRNRTSPRVIISLDYFLRLLRK